MSNHCFPDQILRLRHVLQRVPVSKATLYRWIAEGEFPAPVRLGGNCVGWKRSVINEWIENRPVAKSESCSK